MGELNKGDIQRNVTFILNKDKVKAAVISEFKIVKDKRVKNKAKK